MAGLGTGLFGLTWYRLSKVESGKELQTEFRHHADIPLGVSYFGKYYLHQSDKGLRAFSTKCTHAGCRIGKEHGGLLACSCHGSQFDAATGQPVTGPALKPLQELECYFDKNLGQWVITMKEPYVAPA